MVSFNLKPLKDIEKNYSQGLLPQRNTISYWYQDSSSRSNLSQFQLSSENRRILNKTQEFNFELIPLKNFLWDSNIQKLIFSWLKKLDWDFPISSVKTIFTNHIFNYLYIWKNLSGEIIAYSICYFSESISHIAYVFYDPQYSHGNLPIRLVLQTVIDSHDKGLKYCYLGRFSQDIGFYKRNMPNFEYFNSNTKRWEKYS
jgi:arginyl-tRNA--protein-N-Asp/Glu arginylyltransferase